MSLTEPRIQPASIELVRELEAEVGRKRAPDYVPLNISRTVAQHPDLVRARAPMQMHLVSNSTLPPRQKELTILRVGWNWQSEYEFGQHTWMSKPAGVTDEDVLRVTKGPDAEGWTPFEATLLRAVDQLCSEAFISDELWEALGKEFSTQQLLDFVFLVGQYTTVCMVLRTVGVQLEEGRIGFPEGAGA